VTSPPSVVNGTSLTNITALSQIVVAGTNATYILNLTNNGTQPDIYTLAIDKPSSAVVGLNITSPVSLASGASRIFTLNVTNASAGIINVNVTANSTNDPAKIASINTTTNVTSPPSVVNGTSLTNITALSQIVVAGTNATYVLNLTNNGTQPDIYTLAIDKPSSAVVGLNITSPVSLASGASRIFTLNVTNASAGIINVNVTANSTNDPSVNRTITTITTVKEGIVLVVEPGWSLISVPFKLDNPMPFAGTSVDRVLYYNASMKQVMSVSSVEPLKAYWVNNSANANVSVPLFRSPPPSGVGGGGVPSQSIPLASGWNMIGYTNRSNIATMPANMLLDRSLLGGYGAVVDYIRMTDSYKYYYNPPETLTMKQTVGYWVWATRSDQNYAGDFDIV
jgi:hypothetical protein